MRFMRTGTARATHFEGGHPLGESLPSCTGGPTRANYRESECGANPGRRGGAGPGAQLTNPPPAGGRSRAVTPILRTAQRRPVLEWLAVAAAVLITLGLGIRFIPGVLSFRQADLVAEELVASHIRSLQPGHLMDVVSTDQHTVKPWFDGKIDFAPPVRDLAEQGYPLIGGRLDYVGGRDVAALVYQLRKHYINVFIWPDDGKQGNRPEFVSKEGYNVACMSSGGMRLCGVADTNAEDLRQFMQLLLR